MGKTQKIVLTALLTALSLVLGYMERLLLPLDFAVPGVKLGLANVVVVTGLYLFSFPMALGIALLKSGTAFLISGSVLAYVYSFAGTLLSFLGMWLLKKGLRERISPVSVSTVGGVLHVTGQVAAAILVLRTPALAWYLPVLWGSGAVTGLLIGLAVKGMLPYFNNRIR